MNITYFEELQNEFNSVITHIPQPKNIIENEIKEIENFLIIDFSIRKKTLGELISQPKPTQIFNLKIHKQHMPMFVDSFNSYLLYGIFEVPKYPHDSNQSYSEKVSVSKQANELVKYYSWLKELNTPYSTIKSTKSPTLSHKQKMLALHYLGLDFSKYDNTKIAKILSEVLGLNEPNTRQYLSYLSGGRNNVRTKKNLEEVLQLFENEGLTTISSKIKSDLEKI